MALLVGAEGVVEFCTRSFDGLGIRFGVRLGVFRGWSVLLGGVGLPACGLGEG
jgi:hypothetical protein